MIKRCCFLKFLDHPWLPVMATNKTSLPPKKRKTCRARLVPNDTPPCPWREPSWGHLNRPLISSWTKKKELRRPNIRGKVGKPPFFFAICVCVCVAEKNRLAVFSFFFFRAMWGFIGLIFNTTHKLLSKKPVTGTKSSNINSGAKKTSAQPRFAALFGTELAAMGSCASCATNFTQRCEGSRWIWWSQTIRIGSVQIEEDRARYPYQPNVFLCILPLKTAKISAGELVLDEVVPFCRLEFPALKCIGKGIAGPFHRSTHAQAKLTQVNFFLDQGASTPQTPEEADPPGSWNTKAGDFMSGTSLAMSSRDAVCILSARDDQTLQQVHWTKTSKIGPSHWPTLFYIVNRLAQEVDSVAILLVQIPWDVYAFSCSEILREAKMCIQNINLWHQFNFLNMSPHKDVIDRMRLT